MAQIALDKIKKLPEKKELDILERINKPKGKALAQIRILGGNFVAYLSEVKKHYGMLKNYVDGEWVEVQGEGRKTIINPATEEEIGVVPSSSKSEVEFAVERAQEAWWGWRETPPATRARYMVRVKEVMEKNFEDIARVIVQENGKTIDEARGETRRAIENVEFAIGIPSAQMGYALEDGAGFGIDEEAIRTPLGVFAGINPFNFPAMVPFWFWPVAVATGNTYIIKPSEQTPVTMQYIMELLEDVDFPPGVLNMVHGGPETGTALIEHPYVKGISFVGSTPVGKYIYEHSAKYGKRVQSQGGAKNCLVVMDDANLAASIANMLASCFGCAGQRCLAGSNILVADSVYSEFKELFVDRASKLKTGYGLDESVTLGPVISAKSRENIVNHIERAVGEGGKVLLDGRDIIKQHEKGFFVGPVIIDNVQSDMSIVKEEVFGPVVSLIRIDDLDHALKIIDSIPFGNAASIYTQSGRTAREFKYRVQAGNIGINLGVAAPVAFFPFAGQKQSFFGDLHGQGQDGVNFFTDRKVVIYRW